MCGSHIVGTPEIDHKTPRFLGGSDSDNNLQSLCGSCHTRKTNSESATARRMAREARK
jgi:5-methylcytosine-specific restriction endonuclease McrA